jgi:D-lactate dehydrogenase
MVLDDLTAILGRGRVLTRDRDTRAYREGYRFGQGKVLAVVLPGSLVELWRVLRACVAANTIVITQAANTGLTGGSTPAGDDYDRDVVIVSTRNISKVHVIDAGRQVICLGGTTLHDLEEVLRPLGREPHSVIGSSCIGASVIGGICNNSGGALVRRGPAYTQMALFARLTESGQLELVNHLAVELGSDPEEILSRLERGAFDAACVHHDPAHRGSDRDYERRVRMIDSDRPARFNADPQLLFEASGCAGRMLVFAARLDTFPKDSETRVFYIGTNDPAEFTELRRRVLANFTNLPISGEYIHRHMFDVAEVYGKDAFLSIRWLGTKRLPGIFALKRRFDHFVSRLGFGRPGASDRLLQKLSQWFPCHLPPRMKLWRHRFEHHLLLKVAGPGISEAANHLSSVFPSATGDFFECTETEADKAFLHRFVAAGAAIRYRTVHEQEVGGIVALDVALKRNEHNWCEVLPAPFAEQLHAALYYGHFLCHVFHQDYIVKPGVDPLTVEHELWALLDARGAEYPAEHNVGHLYPAKPALVDFYRGLDPLNSFNAGIGKTSKLTGWKP